jgi:hypothetical protein
VLAGLKKHGMILADNGSDWYISGSTDPRWDDEDLHHIKQLHGSDLEVIRYGRPGDSPQVNRPAYARRRRISASPPTASSDDREAGSGMLCP